MKLEKGHQQHPGPKKENTQHKMNQPRRSSLSSALHVVRGLRCPLRFAACRTDDKAVSAPPDVGR